MSDDTDSLCGCRFVAVGETGRGAELEPDVDGREKTESVGEGGGSEFDMGRLAKGVFGERVKGEREGRGRVMVAVVVLVEVMVSCVYEEGDRVGGVKYDGEVSLSFHKSEAPDDLRLLGLFAWLSASEGSWPDGVGRRATGGRPGRAKAGDCTAPGSARPSGGDGGARGGGRS